MFENKGFYEELEELREDEPEASFGFLENIDTNVKIDWFIVNAYDFLHGFCHTFAYVLSREFGYKIYSIYDEEGVLVHTYCVIPNGNEPIYVDIRGCTSDFGLFIQEFDDFITINEDGGEPLDIREETEVIKNEMSDPDLDEEFGKNYLLAAEELFEDYKSYYYV